jgi:inosine-uridine nucleoside N-ribohydrolase
MQEVLKGGSVFDADFPHKWVILACRFTLRREPRVAERARFVGMQGSVRTGYGGIAPACAEYNVATDARAAQVVFTAPWEITITPLDSCGLVALTGEKYHRVRASDDALVRAVVDDYRVCAERTGDRSAWETHSPTLFDTVAVYLGICDDLLTMERLGIAVASDGCLDLDSEAKRINCATGWKDLPAFEDFLVERLTGEVSK